MSVAHDLIGLLRLRALRLLALTALIVSVGIECFITKLSVLDPDIWWHLSVGDWIVHNRAFPHNGIFSHTAADRPWMAYSWGYEVLLSRAYGWFSFIGIGIFGTLLTVGVALAIFRMLYKISGRFWASWALSIVVFAAFLFNIAPRPLFFSVILFTFLLTLILEAQRTGRMQPLYWLPLIFFLWANIHIQFIYGLAVVGLFAGMNLLQQTAIRFGVHPDILETPKLPLLLPFAVLAACVLASCVGPYSYHLYEEVVVISRANVMYRIIRELQALNFLYFNQYLELLLAVGAYFAIGWRRKIDLFQLALLLFASVFAFRTWRDAWFLCVIAAAIIAAFPRSDSDQEPSLQRSSWAIGAVASVALLALSAGSTDFRERGLDRVISGEYPVDAVNFLRRNPVGGPLYNSFDWGGFLIFYMPQYPVSIDGRTDLYGNAMNEQYYSTQEADPSYATDPVLNEAGLVLVKKKYPIATQLLGDRRFRLIYQDNLASVFARNW